MTRRNSRTEPDKLYFIQAGDDGPIKIGIAVHPKTRLKELQTGNPHKLRLLGVVAGGVKFEQQLHWELRAHRMHGEWFENCDEVLAVLKRETDAMLHGPATPVKIVKPYDQCKNCGFTHEDWNLDDPLCGPCKEFAHLREAGGDPFGDLEAA